MVYEPSPPPSVRQAQRVEGHATRIPVIVNRHATTNAAISVCLTACPPVAAPSALAIPRWDRLASWPTTVPLQEQRGRVRSAAARLRAAAGADSAVFAVGELIGPRRRAEKRVEAERREVVLTVLDDGREVLDAQLRGLLPVLRDAAWIALQMNWTVLAKLTGARMPVTALCAGW